MMPPALRYATCYDIDEMITPLIPLMLPPRQLPPRPPLRLLLTLITLRHYAT